MIDERVIESKYFRVIESKFVTVIDSKRETVENRENCSRRDWNL